MAGVKTLRDSSDREGVPGTGETADTLRASEARFRTVFEQSPVSTQIFSRDGTTVAVNRAWEELWGVTLDQIAGYNILEDQQLIDKGIMPYIQRGFAGEATTIPPVRYVPGETIPHISDVPYRWVSAWIYPVKDELGAIREVVLMHEDITERKHAEEMLRLSEARYRSVVETSPDAIALVGLDARVIMANQLAAEIFGYDSADEMAGVNVLGLVAPVDRGRAQENLRKRITLEITEGRNTEYLLLRKDGHTFPAELSSSALVDDDGRPLAVTIIARDITERKQAEERFRAVFDGAPVGISLIDREGRYIAVNPIRREMLGYSEEELLGRHYQEFTHPEDVEDDLRINAEAREQGRNHYQLEKRFVRSDGSVAWTRITVSMVRNDEGEIQYSISLAEDITDRKRAEEALAELFQLERVARENVEKLAAERAAILGQVAEGIIIADPDGRITFVNEVAHRIHGVNELDVPVESYPDVYHLFTMDGAPYPPDETPLARAVRKGETVVDAEWRIRQPDETEVVAQGSATPVVGEDGDRLGAVVTFRDVTAQHEVERQKDDFLSAVAHDLRTPLTSIKGRIQLVRRRAERAARQPATFLEDLERIDVSATKMVTLINELLDVANIQIGRPLNLVRRPVDLVDLARSVAAEHQQAAGEHRILVEASVPELVGKWDATRLERVLANLLSNAIKYSPRGGNITVGVARVKDEVGAEPGPRPGGTRRRWAVLEVKDQGVGIPAEDLPRIFERFHRGENVTGKIPGTGIGLAAVREIVRQHGGSVTVESEEGVGTTFLVRLPA